MSPTWETMLSKWNSIILGEMLFDGQNAEVITRCSYNISKNTLGGK